MEDTLRLSDVDGTGKLESVGRYRLLSELGRGAMARVFLALDPNISRKIALKVLEPRSLTSATDLDELRTRFLVEARAAGNLRHPSAVAIYDADHDPGSNLSYIAMEWIDGQSLDALLKEAGPLSIERTVSIVTQVAGALDAAHRQGLIHRDVKPANILLDGEGNAKLSDFGIAKIESLELTLTGQVLGTPYYMSPEQIRDEPLDGRSDLFSLGVVLYQCCTGELPFRAESLPALTHKILHAEPRAPIELNRELPTSLCRTIERALAKEPSKRFQTASAFANDLGHGSVASITTTVALDAVGPPAETLGHEDGESSNPGSRHGVAWTLLLAAILIAWIAATWTERVAVPQHSPQSTAVTGPPASSTAMQGSVETPTDATTAAAATVGASTLQISYTNRLKKATLDVWIDGKHVLSKPMTGARGFVRRATGTKVFEVLPVTSGHHDVKVSIRGASGKIEASNWTGHNFEEGQTRRLRIELIPPKFLKLTWKDV